MRKKVKKRLLSLLLCGTMVFSLCPPAAAAVEKDRQNNAGVPNMGRNESKNKAENKASSSNALEQEKMEIASSSNAVQMKNSAMLATMQLNQSEDPYQGPAIIFDTESIKGSQVSSIYFSQYYHPEIPNMNKPYGNRPIKWRVLDNENNENLLLLSDETLWEETFMNHHTTDPLTWENCSLRELLNGREFSRILGWPSDPIGSAVVPSELEDTEDKIFVLSEDEANNTKYFPNADESRKSNSSWGIENAWWLRSMTGHYNENVAFVKEDGSIKEGGWISGDGAVAIRPAIRLDTDAILFALNTEWDMEDYQYGKLEMQSHMLPVEEVTGDEWRLAIKDDRQSSFKAETVWWSQDKEGVSPGEKAFIQYSGLAQGVGSPIFISAILVDEDGVPCYYGYFKYLGMEHSWENGQVAITIPEDIDPGEYTLRVFSETSNNNSYHDKTMTSLYPYRNRDTRFVSDFSDIPITIKEETAPRIAKISAERTDEHTAEIEFRTDEPGQFYYAYVEKGSAMPEIDTSGSGTRFDYAGGAYYTDDITGTIVLSNLTASAKDLYIIAKDESGTLSAPYKIEIPPYAVLNPTWDAENPGRVQWKSDKDAVGYQIQLYFNGSPEGKSVEITGKETNEYTFEIDETGEYSFTIEAVNAGDDSYAFSESSKIQFYQIQFDSRGGSSVNAQMVADGGFLKEPAAPTKEGYIFTGWVQEDAYEPDKAPRWDFAQEPIRGGMPARFVATWVQEESILENVVIKGTEGTVNGTTISVKFPSGTEDISVILSDIKIDLKNSDSMYVSDLKTEDGGKTWTFNVNSDDGLISIAYTIHVTQLSENEPGGNTGGNEGEGGSGSGGSSGSGSESGGSSGGSGSGGSSGSGSGSGGSSGSGSGSGGSSGGGSSSGGSSGGGGGSSSGGGGGASSSSRRPSSTSSTKKPSLPAYVVSGTWSQNGEGQWRFTDGSGATYKGRWAAVENPYANAALGQSGYDWFRFDADGNMVTGWFQDSDGNWYYLNPNSDGTRGRMLTGWFQDVDGSWYYLNPNSDGTRGRMMTGWNWIKDGDGVTRCYYLNPNADGTRGKMAVNTTVENYTLDAEGHWIVDGVIQTR